MYTKEKKKEFENEEREIYDASNSLGQKGNCHRIECVIRLSSPYPSRDGDPLLTNLTREISLPLDLS